MRKAFILRILLIITYSVLLILRCSSSISIVEKDFEDIKIVSYSKNDVRIDLANSNNVAIQEQYNYEDDITFLKIDLDLKDTKTLKLIWNILNENIDAYIVIKNSKGQDIARHKIVIYDDDLIEIIERHKHLVTGSIKYFNEEEKLKRFTFSDSTRYLPQFVLIDDEVAAQDEFYTLYIQASLWNEEKIVFMNICTTPKFISINPLIGLISIQKIFDPIRFFVTGYYRPSTKANLADLELKIQEGIVDLPIDNITQLDRDHVKHVEYAFDTLYKEAQNFFEICIKTKKDEHLLIEFIGSTDPRNISAKYIEKTVLFDNEDPDFTDIQIENGTTMNNHILSELRAYYTMKYVDALFSKSIQYQQLKSQGRIHYRLIGEGPVDQSPDADRLEMAKVRRVKVRILGIPQPVSNITPNDKINK